MTAEQRLARRVRITKDLAQAHALADAVLARARAARARTAPKREVGREKKRNEGERERRHRAKVYAAVDARSGGTCEHSNVAICCLNEATEHDHFWGRGKAEETVENVWHLCKVHHDNKTANDPSRSHWIQMFRRHCYANSYREEMAKCDRALALEEAQHPRNEPSVPVRIVVREAP